MTLSDDIRATQLARSDLRRAAENANGWNDEVRRRFDSNRLAPLEDAGETLLRALSGAEESYSKSLSLMPSDR